MIKKYWVLIIPVVVGFSLSSFVPLDVIIKSTLTYVGATALILYAGN